MSIVLILLILAIIWILLKVLQQKQEIHPLIFKSGSIYSDHTIITERPFYSQKYLLAGKMDKILVIDGKRIPMEIKSSRRPKEPYLSHVMQLMSYCLLMEEHYKEKPGFGLLQYSTGEPFVVPYTDENRKRLLKTMKDMRGCIRNYHC
ncbi:MAG: Dna2/Cas4 domain-containing protein [archaeon]